MSLILLIFFWSLPLVPQSIYSIISISNTKWLARVPYLMSEIRQIGCMDHIIKYLSTLFAYQKWLARVPYLMSEVRQIVFSTLLVYQKWLTSVAYLMYEIEIIWCKKQDKKGTQFVNKDWDSRDIYLLCR